MKTKLLLIPAVLIAALFFIAAAEPPTIQTGILNSIQTDTVTAQAFYKDTVDIHDGSGPQAFGGLSEVAWPIAGTTGSVSITLVNGVTGSVSGQQLFLAVQAFAALQKTAQNK